VKPGGLGNVLVVFGRSSRHRDFPNAPTARELAKNDRDRNLIEILEIPYALSRPFAAPPGVPEDRVRDHAAERVAHHAREQRQHGHQRRLIESETAGLRQV